jgi:hypothetical protein
MQPQPAETFRRDPVQAIARVGVAAARHRIDRSLSIAEHAAKAWPFDSDVQLILRAATDNTIDMTSGAALIQVGACGAADAATAQRRGAIVPARARGEF